VAATAITLNVSSSNMSIFPCDPTSIWLTSGTLS
jgi:hypothetical protein